MRSEFQTTVLDEDGDVQRSKPIVFYEQDGTTPLGQALHDAASGGSLVIAPQTNNVGQLDVYADNGQYLTYTVDGGTLQKGRLDPDPGQIVTLTRTQTLTNKTLTSPTITTPTITGGTLASPAITTPTITGGTIGSAAISGGTLTGILSGEVLGTFQAHGTGAVGPKGLKVHADGTVGMLDSTLSKQASNGLEISRLSSTNFNMIDLFHYVANPGEVYGSYVATYYATPNTIGVGSSPWLGVAAQQIGKFVRITQPGMLQVPKQIVAATDSILTVDPPFFPPINSGNPTFEIVIPGDQANQRTITDVRRPSPSEYGVAGAWCYESTINVQDGNARTGAINFAARMALFEEYTDTVRNVIFSAQTTGEGLHPELGLGVRKRPNIAYWSWGSMGVISHFRADDWQGNVVFDVSEFGKLKAASQVMAGSATLTNTAPLVVKQSAGTYDSGLQLVRDGASTNFSALYTGGDDRLYLHMRVGGGHATMLAIGGTAAQPALQVSGIAGLGAKLAVFGVTGAETASIDTLGYYYVGANNIIGPRGAAIANATDPATTMAAVNAWLARARAHGLIAP